MTFENMSQKLWFNMLLLPHVIHHTTRSYGYVCEKKFKNLVLVLEMAIVEHFR